MLHKVKGPTSFKTLRTVDGHICLTYREACFRLGLLKDDTQWDATLSEALISRSPKCLRALFAILLKTCEVSSPVTLWQKYKNDLSEDIKYQAQLRNPGAEIEYNDRIYNMALIDIEDRIISMGGEQLSTHGLLQGWPSFLCKAPTLLPTRVGCAINVGQGWPTFSVHAPKFFATQAFI